MSLTRRLLGSRLEKLRSAPKGPGTFAFDRFEVEYTHAQSLYHEYKDIFENRIYHFTAGNPDPLIIDAGACIGMSMLYFKSVYPGARVVSFEPDPAMFAVLKRNAEHNRMTGVELVNAGLGRAEGSLDFYPDGSDGGAMFAAPGVKPITVRVERLSRYIQGPVDFLKMNIEGMEGEVFEEIEPCLHHVRELCFEYHVFHDLPQSLGNILAILDRQGFRYVVTDATNAKVPVPITLPADYRYFNLVYARRA